MLLLCFCALCILCRHLRSPVLYPLQDDRIKPPSSHPPSHCTRPKEAACYPQLAAPLAGPGRELGVLLVTASRYKQSTWSLRYHLPSSPSSHAPPSALSPSAVCRLRFAVYRTGLRDHRLRRHLRLCCRHILPGLIAAVWLADRVVLSK